MGPNKGQLSIYTDIDFNNSLLFPACEKVIFLLEVRTRETWPCNKKKINQNILAEKQNKKKIKKK